MATASPSLRRVNQTISGAGAGAGGDSPRSGIRSVSSHNTLGSRGAEHGHGPGQGHAHSSGRGAGHALTHARSQGHLHGRGKTHDQLHAPMPSHQPSKHAPPPMPPPPAPQSLPSLVESLMRESADGIDVSSRLPDLRRAILTDGIHADEMGMSSHRIYTWLILLRAPVMGYDEYAALLRRGASPAYAKINDDTHRTLATDPLFARRVSQNSIARLLNTIAWALEDERKKKQREEEEGVKEVIEGKGDVVSDEAKEGLELEKSVIPPAAEPQASAPAPTQGGADEVLKAAGESPLASVPAIASTSAPAPTGGIASRIAAFEQRGPTGPAMPAAVSTPSAVAPTAATASSIAPSTSTLASPLPPTHATTTVPASTSTTTLATTTTATTAATAPTTTTPAATSTAPTTTTAPATTGSSTTTTTTTAPTTTTITAPTTTTTAPTTTSTKLLNTFHPSPYLQGMNVLSAPFLYVSRSEPQAFACLWHLLTGHIPSYITPTMGGVHRGLALVDRLLAELDPALGAFLQSRGLPASVYAFPAVLTLSACTPPLPELLVLWDFLLSWGVHLNLLAVVAQLHLIRDRIMASDSPVRELRHLGPLRAQRVKDLVLVFVGRVSQPLWADIVLHTGGGDGEVPA